MEFTPDFTIGGIPVQKRKYANGGIHYIGADGREIRAGNGRPLLPIAPVEKVADASAELDMPQTVRLHADAVCALIRAAVWPEWACASGFAQSPRGDSATCDANNKGPNGEKIVRICTVSPGRVTAFYDILIPEYMSFEVYRK